MKNWKDIYIIASISAGIFVFAHHLGRKAGAHEVTDKVNAVLQNQYEHGNIGGTWDAVATELNGEP